MSKTPTRRAGRKARKIARAAGPDVNPAPPGQAGGLYKPLQRDEARAICNAAFELLETLGMGEVPDRLATVLRDAGAIRLESGGASRHCRDL